MPALDVKWPVTALPGRRPTESQGDLVNAYAAKIGDVVEIRRTPGLDRHVELPDPVFRIPRGTHALGDYLLHAWDDELRIHHHTDHSDVSASASLPGASPITMASNLRPTGADVVIVTDLAAYTLVPGTGALLPYADTDLGPVTSVEYFSGYFFFTRANGDIVASDLQSTAVDGLSVAKAEYAADRLYRLKSAGNALLAFGAKTVEVWTDAGTSPFPCTRQTAIDVGLLGRWAVGGGVNTWGAGVFFVAHDYTVRFMDGLTPKIISNDYVSHDIYTWRKDADAIYAQVYEFENQSILSISTPAWTWEHNLMTGSWHRRDSYGMNCWRSYFACSFQNTWYGQDGLHGAINEISKETYNEPDARMRLRIDSSPVKAFPFSIRLPRLVLDMSVGLGVRGRPSPFETDPSVMISWSHDGGAIYGNPVARSLGAEGEFTRLITVNGLGRSTHHGCRIRLEVTDPVPVVLRSGVVPTARPSRPRQVRA